MSDLNADQIEYLGRVAAWLKDEPKGVFDYGEYFIAEVRVCFDVESETVGTWHYIDEVWTFTTGGAS